MINVDSILIAYCELDEVVYGLIETAHNNYWGKRYETTNYPILSHYVVEMDNITVYWEAPWQRQHRNTGSTIMSIQDIVVNQS